jgi:DNA-3-methyladenine glycosylase I
MTPKPKAAKASKTKRPKAKTGASGVKRAATRQRCWWVGDNPLYEKYHDEEWGVPHSDDRLMFEKLTLEAFQSGLSWITILRKRDNFRKAFHNFDAKKVAAYGKKDFDRLMNDTGIVRNRLKIEATISNAGVFVELTRHQSFAKYLWGFLEDGPIVNERKSKGEVPGQTPLSISISKALKKDGFRFVGPTTVYAFMQSMGMVNDHLISCPRYHPCAKAQRAFKPPKT